MEIVMAKRGLDNRAMDKNKQVREKNGATLMPNLVKEYPILAKLNQKGTLTKAKRQFNVPSLDKLIKVARSKKP